MRWSRTETINTWRYYDASRRVCLARRKLTTGEWDDPPVRRLRFTSNDAHNTISIGICPQDGTIHLAFDHHGHPLHYRVSRKGAARYPQSTAWETSLFGPVMSELEKGKPIKITYPRFWQTPDGGLQFCYRQGGSGNGDRMLVDYHAETGTWVDTRQIDSRQGLFQDAMGESRSRCSYPNGYDYGPKGRLHATWVWRESSQGSNHDLMYAYSEDRGKTWLNNLGEALSEPAHVNSPGVTVVNISRAHGLMNTHGQAVDSQGRVHVVMWHCSDQSLQQPAANRVSIGGARPRLAATITTGERPTERGNTENFPGWQATDRRSSWTVTTMPIWSTARDILPPRCRMTSSSWQATW